MSIVEMKVPNIGESITEVTLSAWLKDDGDYVALDEPICEFESDKATLELPAEAAGTLQHVAGEGDDLEIGALVAKIDTSAEAPSDSGGEEKDEDRAGDGEEKEDEKGPGKAEDKEGQKASEERTEAAEGKENDKPVPSPAAAKIMRENDLSPSDVKGTGKQGRITKDDAMKAVKAAKTSREEEEKKEKPEKPDEHEEKEPRELRKSFSREEHRKKMSRMRRTIARRLVSAKNETAMLTTFNEVDLTEVIKLRKKFQDQFVEKYGIKLGFMSIFAKACAKALLEIPEANAFIDGDELIYHDYVDISIAISTPNGLVVPPVHNVESLEFHEIELKIKELAEKARDNKLSLEEMQGGTFTITNGGIFGSMLSTPILNEPQSAILGMHAIKERPVVVDGQVEVRPMMYLALSYDHRVIDGSSSVTFLVKVIEALEDPVRMLIDV